MNLYDAHAQWASRPKDERFSSISDLHGNVTKRDAESKDGRISLVDATFEAKDGEVLLVGPHGNPLRMTHWSAGQMFNRLGVPRDLLPKLDDATIAAVLNDRLPKALKSEDLDNHQRVLVQGRTLRALHSGRYERLWDQDVTYTLMEFLPPNWRNPVAYDPNGGSLKPGGLYAGDRDMFAFLISGGDMRTTNGAFDVDGDQFYHGFFVWNSEVGAKSFGWCEFKMRFVCGNNIIWGATDIGVTRARHIGNANHTLRGFQKFLRVLNEDHTDDAFVNAVRAAKQEIAVAIAVKKDDTLEKAFTKFGRKFTRTEINNALEIGTKTAEQERRPVDGSRWFWLQGFTAAARLIENADERTSLEQRASDMLLVPVKR